MTTPDPIALPELPEGWVIGGINYGSGAGISEGATLYTADDMRAYGQACVDALTPAPQVPADAVLRFLSHLEDVMDDHPEVAGWVDVQLWNAISTPKNTPPSTPPLNELPGDSGQLASLEQRARELLAGECENSGFPEQAADLRIGLKLGGLPGVALRAITAALSAQPRETAPRWAEVMCRQCGRPTMHMGSLCFSCSKASRDGAEAAPQQREVRGVDGKLRGLLDRIRPGIEVAPWVYAEIFAMFDDTTPQDAAGVVAYPTGSDREVLLYLMQQFDVETWECPGCGHAEDTATMDSADYLRKYLAEHPATPPPGVDVAALRQIAGELRDNAHHHQQEDREVGIFADEQEAQFNTELAERIERALTGDAAVWTPEMIVDIHRRGEALHARINTPQPGVDLEQFRPAVEALERAGRVSEVKDGQLHWHLNEKHWEAQRLFAIIDAAAPGTGKDSLQVGGAGSGVLP